MRINIRKTLIFVKHNFLYITIRLYIFISSEDDERINKQM